MLLSFDQIHLREKYTQIYVEDDVLYDNDLDDPIEENLLTKLKHTEISKEGKDFLGDYDSAYDYILSWFNLNDGVIYLIKSEGEPIGLVAFSIEHFHFDKQNIANRYGLSEELKIEQNDPFVNEIYLLAFKPNQITLVKDTFELFKQKLDKYGLVMFTVLNTNPIKKAYDRIKEKLSGHSFIGRNGEVTYYLFSKS
jgi:hypothetical protein